jgi:hypothetical protein
MWDFGITISPSKISGIEALGSTHHLEIALAAINPSRSKEDKISSFRLQESQLPPKESGVADSVSAEDPVTWLLVSWDAALPC